MFLRVGFSSPHSNHVAFQELGILTPKTVRGNVQADGSSSRFPLKSLLDIRDIGRLQT